MPEEWRDRLVRWSGLNRQHRIVVDDVPVPDANEEYLLYQALVGSWPLEPYNSGQYAEYVGRIQAYMRKALHEAKVHTSWINPNLDYDQAVEEFIGRIMDPEGNAPFIEDLLSFQRRISYHGMVNSLSQTLIKITAPGVADVYQGTELWDFSLVDPDNRRLVDFERRQRLLNELQKRTERDNSDRRPLIRELKETWRDGRIKLYTMWQALRCRRQAPALFSEGEYWPVEATGPAREHVFSFIRQRDSHRALVAVPRLLTKLLRSEQFPSEPSVFGDTAVVLPEAASSVRSWLNVFTGEILSPANADAGSLLPAAQVLADFPVALLLAVG
jgi:(1->4)-alpha-D-glucan 1-alpha-D-glucosylmutase